MTTTITTKTLRRTLLLAAVVCTPATTYAHHAEFMAAKPFLQGMSILMHGVDHMLVIFAVGLIAAQVGGRALWVIPSAFVVSILLGGLLNVMGVAMPLLEFGVLASVAVCGGLLAWGTSVSFLATLGTVSVFAVFHGKALIGNDGLVRHLPLFILGCLLSAVLLLGLGMGAGMLLEKTRREPAYRYAGFAMIAVAAVIAAFPSVNDFVIRLIEN